MERSEIQRLMKKTGLRPQKAAGQNFLMDESVPAAMIDAAQVGETDVVLEIGPGLGILTRQLLDTGARVIAVELDKRLASHLRTVFGTHSRFTLIENDIFAVNLREHVQDFGYKLVANLPYSATSLVFRNFLSLPPRPTSMTLLIQKEVAHRLSAPPGEMSMLAVMAQYYSQPAYLFDVAKTSFYPAPEVTSAVVHCEPINDRPPEEAKKVLQLAKIGFSGRRKQLHNTLASGLHREVTEIQKQMEKLGIPSTSRPQDLSVEDWLTLAKGIV